MTSESADIVIAKQLTAAYDARTIWQAADFTIKRGEFVGLLGANGSGKTTLLRLLLGLMRPQSGNLQVFGEPPRRGDKRIGYVPQRRAIDAATKIETLEYVRLGTYQAGWGFSRPAQAVHERKQAMEMLDLVDSRQLAHQSLSELSGGELQRVWLAQALVGKPDLLLLDEPLANLDLRRENELIQLIKGVVNSQNIAVLLIAHDINPLLPAVNRIIYIANGKLASGTPKQIINNRTLSALYDAPIEVVRSSRGRLAVLGVEEATHHAG